MNEEWDAGALHEAMIGLDGMSPLLGGSAVRARQHFDRAVALADGKSAYAYVTLAETVSVAARDRTEFEKLLKTALAIDLDARPSLRLANLVAQRRARFLLEPGRCPLRRTPLTRCRCQLLRLAEEFLLTEAGFRWRSGALRGSPAGR